ncbi:MAG: hypothetical protein A2528_01120 [Candidatus Staskawiczbacteria bacterium RIFOXYD2_FULL_37_9]|uniref:Uncharacterized protein n=1 Tax=Candidatus Staskawiczbacteria bacterium RIFOXYB1_FULL_37_44 TaxID=1802223 RepID=A0A1G2IX88_9BACT|nr:MAG: hypothetical protein A2358_00635 [Candidatus Staskawiczbacteria bacterium RIFOXYB1_FULL_37_44]OGZ83935.1 MAG: hypothetical protein A2416_01530 [Candidatus Staskawiczbacteria bacterium RIFOXYC1_FULL_37_52]OGZ88978.1 MAG: hypothetical protein A2444_00580 [Candidatus Staskawiczbacteria bacterium RIFOXYC2_FULL_37_19]OGZ94345.1 MAG: hypothetical protein A2528_01120 [Candidatus Staskawiczbacteria bacterium RIFOXYD2_FULL_37_9]
MEKANKNIVTLKNKLNYRIIDIDDKCLVLKIDFNVALSKACEVIALFSPERKAIAEKLVKDLNESN